VTSAAPAPAQTAAPAPAAGSGFRTWIRSIWHAVSGAIGAVVGLAPHVLHHVGFLAGTALIAGTAGTVLFGVVGLLASVPMLLRLRRRFGTWRAPAIALGVFAAMFSLSAFVLGPAIAGDSGEAPPGVSETEHEEHGH
jgi:hypothetical protein